MLPGTIALSLFGAIFFGLQVYWLLQTMKVYKEKEEGNVNGENLLEIKKQLERNFRQ